MNKYFIDLGSNSLQSLRYYTLLFPETTSDTVALCIQTSYRANSLPKLRKNLLEVIIAIGQYLYSIIQFQSLIFSRFKILLEKKSVLRQLIILNLGRNYLAYPIFILSLKFNI